MFWRGVAFLKGCGIFGEVLAVFWRGVGVWHFGGACSVLEGCGILEVLAVFWRGVAFWRGACSVLEGCGIFGGCLQCFGGVWHFGGACSVLEGCVILEKLAVFWRGIVRVQYFICDFLSSVAIAKYKI